MDQSNGEDCGPSLRNEIIDDVIGDAERHLGEDGYPGDVQDRGTYDYDNY